MGKMIGKKKLQEPRHCCTQRLLLNQKSHTFTENSFCIENKVDRGFLREKKNKKKTL